MSNVALNSGIGGSCIILDIGTQSIRIGNGGEDLPKCIVPNCVGISSGEVDNSDSNYGNILFPLKPWEKRDYIEVIAPFTYNLREKTIEINEEYLSRLLQDISVPQKYTNIPFSFSSTHNYIFEPFEDRISGHSLFLPIHSTFNQSHSGKLAEIAFEKLEVSSLFLSRRSVLSCFSCGRTSGIVVDIGASFSNVSCVQDGHCIQNSIQEYSIAGDFLDNEIYKKIHNKVDIIPEFGVAIDSGSKDSNKKVSIPLFNVDNSYLNWGIMHVVRSLKHSCLSFSNNNSEAQNTIFTLPDGNTIDTSSIRNSIPNLLFKNNNHNSQSYPGLIQMIVNSISEISNSIKDISSIASSIVLAGGTTLISGFDSKLYQNIVDQKNQLLNNQVCIFCILF
ncbi:hypothetical protein FG386_002925 [Cryptosporidium ryanae]|uniref:uncharacterized protein n=1 Tax=Cryptosporidium ryanae TaxID=515981 RepID=UPI00351AA309|nr:hypothetical protein FG386_002925 [Cryptosporidium ryanae]